MPVQFLGDEFAVGTTQAGHQIEPTVTVLTDGRYVVAWQSDDPSEGSGTSIRARMFNADGTPAGDDFLVNSTTGGTQGSPSIVATADGGFFAAWHSFDNGAPDASIRGRLFDSNGAAAEPDFFVNNSIPGSQTLPVATLLSDGTIAVAWQSSGGDGSGQSIGACVINADGTPADRDGDGTADGDFLVNSSTSGHQWDPQITALADGQFVVTWESHDPGSDNIRARIFGADGAAGDDFVVNSSTTLDEYHPRITALPTGGFVAVWTQSGDVRARAFNEDGSPADLDGDGVAHAEFVVNSTTAGDQAQPQVLGLEGGKFLVVWHSNDGADGDGYGIRARLFNAEGTPAGNEYVINTHGASTQSEPTLALLPDGTVLVSWQSHHEGNWNIRGQIIDPDGGTVAASDDVIVGSSDAEAFEGGEGFDIASYEDSAAPVTIDFTSGSPVGTGDAEGDTYDSIERFELSNQGDGFTGYSGADESLIVDEFVDGGAGADSLAGGAGDDILTGGAGADTIDGGAGFDAADYSTASGAVSLAYSGATGVPFVGTGDAAGDTISNVEIHTLSSHGDTFTGYTGADAALIVNDVVAGGDGNDTLNGGSGGDLLFGERGNDTLDGGDGDDVLDGGAGSNTLRGGAGNDTVALTGGTNSATTEFQSVELGAGTDDRLSVDFSDITQAINANVTSVDADGTNGYIDITHIERVVNFSGIEQLTITTGTGNDSITGVGNEDLIGTGAGNDTIVSGAGAGRDRIDAGEGTDSVTADWSDLTSGQNVTLDLNDATGVTLGTGATERYLRGVERLAEFSTGEGADTITLNADATLSDNVTTNGGDDRVNLSGGTTNADTEFDNIAMGAGSRDHLSVDFSNMTQAINANVTSTDENGSNGHIDITNIERVVNFSGVEQLTITTGTGNDSIQGVGNEDLISTGAGNDTIVSGPGAGRDRIDAGEGTDTVTADWSDLTADEDVVLDLNDATGVTLGAGATERYLRGVERLAEFSTGGGDDTITLNADATLRDNVTTNDGDDSVSLSGGTTNVDTELDNIAMGAGTGDHLSVDFSDMTQAINANVTSVDAVSGTNGFIEITNIERVVNFSGVEQLTITTGSGNDSIQGVGNEDLISTGAGNDTIVSGPGAGRDRIDAGEGTDSVTADWSDLTAEEDVVLDLNDATGVTLATGETERYLRGVERLAEFSTGGGDDTITLNADATLRDNVTTNGGDDSVSLSGGTSSADTEDDTIAMGAGTGDHLLVDYSNLTQRISMAVTSTDANGSNGYVEITNIERVLNFSGVDRLTVKGGEADDLIVGLSGDDSLSGGGGNDIVEGEAGSDGLSGGAGDDKLFGGADADYLDGGEGSDVLVAGAGADIFEGGLNDASSAIDTASYQDASAAVSVDLSVGGSHTGDAEGDAFSNIERFLLSNLADSFTGSVDADRVSGGGGNDTIDTGGGDDTIEVSAGSDTATAGAGTDTLLLDSSSGISIGTLTGTAANGYSGTAGWSGASMSFSGIENFTIIARGNAHDTVTTGDGSDRFVHYGQNSEFYLIDNVNLGGGDDVLSVDFTAVTSFAVTGIFNSDGSGTFRVAGNGKLAYSNVEHIHLVGGAQGDSVTGLAATDLLSGMAGNDTLSGAGGDDVIEGGDGNDTLSGDRVTVLQATDNQNSSGTGSADGDVGVSGNYVESNAVEFDIKTGSAPIAGDEATLTIVARDVDPASGALGDERDAVYLNGHFLGYLTLSPNNDNALSTSNFAIDPALLDPSGNNEVRIYNTQTPGSYNFTVVSGALSFATPGGGDDVLEGGDGDDLLLGGVGADAQSGGAGLDTASYSDALAGVTIEGSETG